MAQFLKRANLGRMVVADGGASDPDLAEVRFTPEEYFSLLEKIKSAELKTSEARDDAERRVRSAYKDALWQLEQYREKLKSEGDRTVEQAEQARRRAEERASSAEKEKEVLKDALARQRGLNDNLKRIAKERANAKRGLTPKKERSGYIVLFTSQYRERYRNHEGEKCVANAWKSVLQTPYNATLPLDLIKDEIWDELIHKILFPMGFRRVQPVDKNGEYKAWFEDNIEICGLYRWDYKANFKTGLWEITLYHTKCLNVPEEYRPAQ